ncbi:MAG: signal peptidase I [Candidatus Roizmanbacteria bacterium]
MSALKAIIEFVMDILETVVFIGSLFIVVYLFIIQPNQVRGASMEPTFQTGDFIFTSKVTYKFRTPQRGDVVVFHSPRNPEVEYIKRIIGIPGDSIKLSNRTMYVNETPLKETYISASTTILSEGFLHEDIKITVPQGYIFVMGDNRPRSSDSREFGPVPISSVIGQVFFRYFPADKLGPVSNPLSNQLHSLNIQSSFMALR